MKSKFLIVYVGIVGFIAAAICGFFIAVAAAIDGGDGY